MTKSCFSAESLQERRDRVGYEDWFLESVYKLAESELFPEWSDAVIYELDAPAPVVTVHGRPARRRHLCRTLALGPCDSATLVTDAPECARSLRTCALSSAL